jgi:hypothetical protein
VKKNDSLRGEQRLQKAKSELLNLIPRLNKRKLKTKKEIETRIENILKKHDVKRF